MRATDKAKKAILASGFCADKARVSAAVKLAARINDFAREYDCWDYEDALRESGGLSASIRENAEDILRGTVAHFRSYLLDAQEGLDDDDYIYILSGSILEDLNAFCDDVPEEENQEEKYFSVVYDGGNFIDSFKCSTIEESKAAALDVLLNWEFDILTRMPGSLSAWTQENRDEWDSMIYDCCVFVKEGDDGEIVWEPDDKDLSFVSWLPYDELVKAEINNRL